MLWRVLFESADIHNRPDKVRRAGWVYFRSFVILQGSAIVFFFSPENILRASGRIEPLTSYTMGAIGSFLVLIGAILIHHGLDIATERKSNAVGVYIVIAAISVVYSLLAGLL